jgi:hypothetical protein
MKDNDANSPLGVGGIEERLWNFIDGTASADEKTVIEQLLLQNAAWKEKYVNELLKSTDLEAPSLRFTKNVMEEISKLHIAPATKSYINQKVIWGLGFFFIAMLVSFVIYAFTQVAFSGGEQSTISKNLDKVDFSKIFNNNWVNACMMVNVVLGLVLLDHYLGIKRKQFRKEA